MIMIKKTGVKKIFIDSVAITLHRVSIKGLINFAKDIQSTNRYKQITITF